MQCSIRWLIACATITASAALVFGCSGAQETADDTTADSVDEPAPEPGVEPVVADEPEPVEEPEEPPAEAGGSGRLRIAIKASGEPASGRVRILTAEVEPRVVEEGSASQTYDLPAGRYDVQVTMEDTLDRPEKRLRDVPVKAGETTEREVNFPVGVIKLQPRRGRALVRSKVRWRYNGGGDWFEGFSQTGENLTLSCGRYDAEIQLGRTKIVIEDIQIYEGVRSVSPAVTVGGRR